MIYSTFDVRSFFLDFAGGLKTSQKFAGSLSMAIRTQKWIKVILEALKIFVMHFEVAELQYLEVLTSQLRRSPPDGRYPGFAIVKRAQKSKPYRCPDTRCYSYSE